MRAVRANLALLSILTIAACRPSETRPVSEEPAASAVEPPRSAPTMPPRDPFKPIGGIEGENPAYDRSRRPAEIVAALDLKPGYKVADLGAGRGYLTFRLADAVGPHGRVVATDVDGDAVQTLLARAAGRTGVIVRRARPDDPGLEPSTYDLVLMSEVDHFLSDRVAYLAKVKGALAPGGRIAVTHARALRAPLEAAALEAGLSVVRDYDALPNHYLLVFR
ncbi:MAG: class I SAM-dependent methyltransferase [Rubrivivax sp.]